VPDLPGYAEGAFAVQDPSTAAAVNLLDPRPGERILDACAAPGGKTVAVADVLAGNGSVVAMDLHRDRLALLRDSMKRTRCRGVDVVRGNASRPEDVDRVSGGEAFDRILLDVPCSNTGVLRRRPDARWRFTTERLGDLVRRQRAILDGAAPFLKPGGTLVYSTCSLEPEEGPDQVNTWLRGNSRFEHVATSSLFPPDSGTDGIFAAAVRRRA
jgi:16S rRNA (cytosine967-C5)-methyltransferase